MNAKPVIPVRNKPNVSPNHSLHTLSTADHNVHTSNVYVARGEYKSV